MSLQRAAIYIRVSTEDQRDGYGLESQQEECQRFAAKTALEVVKVFRDEGVSGTHGASERPGFSRMLDGAIAGEFETLIIYAWDRFSRDLMEALQLLAQLRKADITIVEARTGQAFQESGTLLGLVSLWGADVDHKKILQRTKLGHISRAKSGKVAGPPPFGYEKTADGKLAIFEEEAEVVRRIYRLYLDEGYGVDKIADVLNAEGVKTKRAKANEAGKNRYIGAARWQRSTIICMFRNPVYKGAYVYGKTKGKVPVGREYRPNPKRPVQSNTLQVALKNRKHLPHEQVTIEVPAIVDAQVWEQVQAVREKRANLGPIKRLREGATKYSYAFPGLIRCNLCQRVMTPWKHPYKRKKDGTEGIRAYYVCRNKDRACPNLNKYHSLRDIDHQIVSRIVPYLENPELIRQGMMDTVFQKQQEHGGLQAQARLIEQRLHEVTEELTKLKKGYLKNLFTDDEFAALRQELDLEIDRAQQELATIEAKVKDLAYDDEQDKLEDVVALFHSIAVRDDRSSDFPWDRATPNLIWWGGGKEQRTNPMADIDPQSPLAKLVQGLVKHVTINLDSEIVEYKLRIDPKKIPPSQPPKKARTRRGMGTIVSGPSSTAEEALPGDIEKTSKNYKAKRNSITSPFSRVQGLEWPLPPAASDDSSQPCQPLPGR